MLLYFITWISPLLKPLASWACVTNTTLFPFLFCQELSVKTISKMFFRNLISTKVENVEDSNQEELSLLDLPELPLEYILEKLPPSSLLQMASVCCSLRKRCVSDYLWKNHMKQKWGGVIGAAAYREWKWYIASKRGFKGVKDGNEKGFVRFFSLLWAFQWMRLKVDVNDGENKKQRSSSLSADSVMNCYLALETGSFWFPAQVYNRENGHVGFVLSCYDAELRYDSRTDSFQARYPPHGRRLDCRECGIPWKRLRAPPVDTPPHDLHISDCLNDLHPGDHIEIQWRRNKEFPYGWWYGVVGHLESCDGNENYCCCHSSDTLVLEFNHYSPGSRWRKTTVSRKDHREEGNEADGFYGGIRKIKSDDEISIWKSLWPSEILE